MDNLVRMHVEPVLSGATAIFAFEGWNDAGESATTALQFVDEAICSVPLAAIDPENFYDFTVCRPEVFTDADNRRQIRWPGNQFRFGSADSTREIVTYSGVEPHLKWRGFCDCITEVTRKTQVERVILLGSYLADVVYSQPVQITGYASNEGVLDSIGISPSHYQGPTGILGVLGARFEADGYEVVSLWAGLPHYINARPNPRGALALLQVLEDFLELEVDLEPMYRSAAEFEERISRLVSGDPELSDYVKQLKRREFAL